MTILKTEFSNVLILSVSLALISGCKQRNFNKDSAAKSREEVPSSEILSFDARFPATEKVILKCSQNGVEVAKMLGKYHGETTVSEVWFDFSPKAKDVEGLRWLMRVLVPNAETSSAGTVTSSRIKILGDRADSREPNCESLNWLPIAPINFQTENRSALFDGFRFKSCGGISYETDRVLLMEKGKSSGNMGLYGDSSVGLRCKFQVSQIQALKSLAMDKQAMDLVLLDNQGLFFQKRPRAWRISAESPMVEALINSAVQFKMTDSRKETRVGYAAGNQDVPGALVFCETVAKVASPANPEYIIGEGSSGEAFVMSHGATDYGWLKKCSGQGVKRLEISFIDIKKIELIEPPSQYIREVGLKQWGK